MIMTKNKLYAFVAVVLGLTMITTSLVARTYAKYATEITAVGSVTVAKWVADFKDDAGQDFDVIAEQKTFDLFESYAGENDDTGVAGKLLAPGTSGSFDVYYDTSGTQTARNVTITLDASGTDLNTLEYFKFYLDEDKKNDITAAVLAGQEGNLYSQDFGPTDDGKGTVTVYWEWPFEAEDDELSRDEIDALDTADGEAAISAELTITFTATQLDTY
jgi:hypothetical protein